MVKKALKAFNKGPKAISRSSGGLIRAVPSQLVIYDRKGENGLTTPEVRIKVKFKDFRRDAKGVIVGSETVMGTKIVSPAEIVEPFSYNLDGQQRFLMDFGRGVIPVYVFRYGINESGKAMALFVEIDDVERVILGPEGKTVTTQVYQASRDLLRYACSANRLGQDEYDLALENYRLQKESKVEPIPEVLKVGPTIEGPANLTYEDFRRFVSKAVKGMQLHNVRLETRTFASKDRVNDDEMFPFGVFESGR